MEKPLQILQNDKMFFEYGSDLKLDLQKFNNYEGSEVFCEIRFHLDNAISDLEANVKIIGWESVSWPKFTNRSINKNRNATNI